MKHEDHEAGMVQKNHKQHYACFSCQLGGKKDQQPSGQYQTREWQASVPKAVSDWLIAQPPIRALNPGVFPQPKAVIFSGWCHNVIVSELSDLCRFVTNVTFKKKMTQCHMFLNRQVGFDSGLMGASPSRRRRPSAPLFAMPGVRTENRWADGAGKNWEMLR